MTKERMIAAIDHITGFTDDTENARIQHPFSVIGPAGNDKDVLRIYAYGGCVGKLKGGNGHCELLDRDYFNNHGEAFSAEEKAIAEKWIGDSKSSKGTITGTWCDEVVDSSIYLKMSLKALKSKFQKTNGDDKERNLQMEILSRFLKGNPGWCIVDVETGITKKILPDSSIIENVKKPDFVVFDKRRKQFGIIEMKAFNDNTDNLYEHYSLFDEIYMNPGPFIDEMRHRATIMAEYGLIEQDDFNTDSLVWFGFLFVKGGIDGSRELIEKYMPRNGDGEWNVRKDCRFLYVEDVKDLNKKGLAFEEMSGIEGFMSK